MCVPEVCSHEIVCVEDSVAPVAAAEEGATDVGGCYSDAGEQTLIGISTDAVNVIILLTANVLQ